MVGVDYDYVPAREHRMLGAPKGKIPFVWHKDINGGQPMGDSQFIIAELISSPSLSIPDPDAALSAEQRAIGTAVQCMLEESLYFGAIIQMRWGVASSFWGVTLDAYFGDFLPNPYKILVGYVTRRAILSANYAQGAGRHTNQELVHKSRREILALARILANKPYMLGDSLSTCDATCYGYLAAMMHGDWEHEIRQVLLSKDCSNLRSYVARMRSALFPELQTGRKRRAEGSEQTSRMSRSEDEEDAAIIDMQDVVP